MAFSVFVTVIRLHLFNYIAISDLLAYYRNNRPHTIPDLFNAAYPPMLCKMKNQKMIPNGLELISPEIKVFSDNGDSEWKNINTPTYFMPEYPNLQS